MIRSVKEIEQDMIDGFNSLIFLSTINSEFKEQIKQVEKWQKKQQSPLKSRLAELKEQ